MVIVIWNLQIRNKQTIKLLVLIWTKAGFLLFIFRFSLIWCFLVKYIYYIRHHFYLSSGKDYFDGLLVALADFLKIWYFKNTHSLSCLLTPFLCVIPVLLHINFFYLKWHAPFRHGVKICMRYTMIGSYGGGYVCSLLCHCPCAEPNSAPSIAHARTDSWINFLKQKLPEMCVHCFNGHTFLPMQLQRRNK